MAETFFTLVKKEILEYLNFPPRTKVGILLTGGMDSRIVACALKEIQHDIPRVQVKAFTWGLENSRDIEYAKRISKIYQWDWEHLEVSADQMLENLEATVESGSEYSPIHLHAMLQLKNKAGEIDCYLAGSFGDSVGRAEYSGIRVEKLSSHLKLINKNSLIRKELLKNYYNDSEVEVGRYHKLFPQDKNYQLYEQDYQLHYMRKMLNSCMSVINNAIPLYQVFSSPSVYSYMWSLSPSIRNNKVYEIILERKGNALLEIPWARTGLIYPYTRGIPDNLTKESHKYGELIRKEILPRYKHILFSSEMESLKIFNTQTLKMIYGLCASRPIKNDYCFEEQLLWIISLIQTCHKYKIRSPSEAKEKMEYGEVLRGLLVYHVKYLVRS